MVPSFLSQFFFHGTATNHQLSDDRCHQQGEFGTDQASARGWLAVWKPSVLCVCVCLAWFPATAVRADNMPRTITEFDEPFSFGYLAFEKAIDVKDGVAHINAPNGQGGAGLNMSLDLTACAEFSPAVWVRVGQRNEAQRFRMFFASSEDDRRAFTYNLKGVGTSEFVRLLPEDGLAISPALTGEADSSFDPAKITTLQVQGDWTAKRIDLWLDKVELVPATDELRTMRAAYTERVQAEAARRLREEAQRQEEIARLLKGAPHPADGPNIAHVGTVAPDILAITVEDGVIELRPQHPYVPQPGDEISASEGNREPNVLQWSHGQIVDAPKQRSLLRKRGGRGRAESVGFLVEDDTVVAPGPEYRGVPLTLETVGQPAAYRIGSSDDPTFADPAPPADVFIKCKPVGQADNQIPVCCTIYLRTAVALRVGATYTIELRGINTRQAKVAYKHEPRNVRTDAIHVSQIGCLPDAPFKRAYLSTWLGTGGALEYDVTHFELLDHLTGQTVYRGAITLGFPVERAEAMRGGKNHSQTNVYYLDFHDFQQPGEYRVFVPGIGTSLPFRLAENVWQAAFRISMHGFLTHRNGIALGPPYTDYRRPRPMHPTDGVRVFELDVTFWNGEAEAVDRCLRRLLGDSLDTSRLKEYPAAWGGYMDAGDWDRRSQHLSCTLAMLELCDLFPAFFAGQRLALPDQEANDSIPDLLNESLWNLECYRRLQREDGGVGGGIESTSHPKPGEASWQESLLLGTFAPDPETSLRYAACAARAARLLQSYDVDLAQAYRVSAERAWQWAVEHEETAIAATVQSAESRAKDPAKLQQVVRRMHALASVELLQLTSNTQYDAAVRKLSWLGTGQGDPGTELDLLFAYARLPQPLGDPALKARATAWFEKAARESLQFAQENAFNLACRVPQLPMIGYVGYYSVPETSIGCVLPRAHYLTGNPEYLAGALAAAQFSAGANPMNMTLTTGLGLRYPRHPLHVDSQHAGLEPPRGITVYGNSDPTISDGSTDWAHTWFLSKGMIPTSRTWPAAEFYVDLGNWPPMNEYTVHQTFAPTAYYWGYLAAASSRNKDTASSTMRSPVPGSQ